MTNSATTLSSQARPLDAGPITLIVLMCMVWGLNQVAIKFSLPDFPPFAQTAIRSAGGLLIVYAWVRFRGIKLFERDGSLVAGLVSGVLFAVEFLLIFRGMVYTSASRASLFIYTAPFFVALLSVWFLPNERLGRYQWMGLGLCFLGVLAAVGLPQANVSSTVLFGDLLLIGGGAAWGATTIVMKATRLSRIPPEKTLIYQLAVSIPILVAASTALGETVASDPRLSALLWLVFQVAVCGFTFPIWFTFIQRFSATRVSAFTFLTPLFGVAAGCLLLKEPFTVAFGLAVVLVIAGLVLVNRRA
jgi:drug/metabolite transporter (DMT)-like permease